MIEWDYLSCRFSEKQANGFIGFQPDRDGTQPGGRTYEAIFPYGDFGRPLDPDPDQSGQGSGSGVGCNALVARIGDREGFMMPCLDPRYQAKLPDPGKGGRGTYSCLDFGGGRLDVAYEIFYGAGVPNITAGTYVLRVPTAGGHEHRIDIDLANDRILITHASGILLELTAAGVALGGAGGHAVLLDGAGRDNYFSQVSDVAAAVGLTVTPPPSRAATKVTAT